MKKSIKLFQTEILVIFTILFMFSFFYLPILKCFDSVEAKESVCETYSYCEVDYYYSVFSAMVEGCPFSQVLVFQIVLYTAFLVLMSYLVAYVAFMYYKKYRDI